MNQEFRKTPPVPLPAIPFNLQNPEKFTLSNGLKVVVIEDRRFPTVSLRLGFRFGDADDPAGSVGVNSAMAALITEGTENYTSRELAEKIDSLGADVAVGTGFDNTIMSAASLSVHFEELIELMSEILFRPVFPDKELDLYKQNAIEGLKYQRSQPDFLADEQVSKIVFGKHPYSVNSPHESDFTSLNRDDIVAAYKRGIIPNNAVLVSVGDLSAAELRSRLEVEFAGWVAGDLPERNFPKPPVRAERSLTIVDRPGSTQANIVLSNLAIKRNDSDYFPFLLMNQVLGAGASSRLFMNLREEKGYTYGAYSRIYARRLAGSFEATSEVRTSVTGESLKEFFYELERIRNEKVGEDELNDAKNFLAGVFPIRAETQSGLIGLVAAQQLHGLPDDYLDTYRENIRAVTAAEILEAANKYVHPDSLAMVIVGDAAEVLSQAASYADDVAVFDSLGNSKDPQKYESPADGECVDISGTWKVSIDAQGQKMPVTVIFSQDGTELSGQLESMLGEGQFTSGSVAGNRFNAVAVSEFQGQEVELSLNGLLSGDIIQGTISVPMMPEPLSFEGSREG